MSYAEPRYPDDYEILQHTGPGRTISLSSVPRSSAALAACDVDTTTSATEIDLQKRRRYEDNRRAKRDADYAAAVAADPCKRRLCQCGCGMPMPPVSPWRHKSYAAIVIKGHNSTKSAKLAIERRNRALFKAADKVTEDVASHAEVRRRADVLAQHLGPARFHQVSLFESSAA